MKSQIAISGYGHGGRRKAPYAFSEYGAIMAANVLKSSITQRGEVKYGCAFFNFENIHL